MDPIKFTLAQKHQRVQSVEKTAPEAEEAVGINKTSLAERAKQLPTNESEIDPGQACNLDDPDCLMCGS